jgi:serine phosphatase RsbU (regulator of sigma subunit)
VSTPHLSISAKMVPAEDVGGDYYDIIPTRDGAWLAIGDVAGHGLEAGIIMLMIQSAVASLTNHEDDPDPKAVVSTLNKVLYENIRRRLGGDQHVTFSLAREYDDGRFVFAGAHEDIVVYRANTRRCERLETPGTWLGAIRDVAPHTHASSTQLRDGDLVILYSDGITEAMAPNREQFGLERLCKSIERAALQPVGEIRDMVYEDVGRFSHRVSDDRTLIVARYSQAPHSS